MFTLPFVLALLAPVGGAATAVPLPSGTTVSELVVIARREATDPSAVETDCVWRELPSQDREQLQLEAARVTAGLGERRPPRLASVAISDAGAAAALLTCGAPADPQVLPFVKTAVRFYALEQAVSDRLAEKGLGQAKLETAWRSLGETEREALAQQAGDLYQGAAQEPRAMAGVLFRLLRRLRPMGALNPSAYRNGATNHLIVAYYTPRAVRHAMEKRF